MSLVCPRCGKAFGEDDVNVRTDVAHCRSCGLDSSYATLKETEEFIKSLHEAPPKHFKAELTDRGVGWGDLRLTFCSNVFGKRKFLVSVVLFLSLGVGSFFYPWPEGCQDVSVVLPITSAIIIALLTIIAASVQRTLELEMVGGKGRVWTYWLFRGKGRSFDYTGKTEFGFHAAEGFLHQPVLNKFMVANPQQKPLVFRVTMSESDAMFLQAALVYALPRDETWFEPEPDRPETPEEAAARRVEEHAAEQARKWDLWKLLLAIALGIGFAVFRIWLKHR